MLVRIGTASARSGTVEQTQSQTPSLEKEMAQAGTGNQCDGVVRSAMLPGWAVAVVQLEWQLWDSPALSQAPTVAVLQRIRAQLIPFLVKEAI